MSMWAESEGVVEFPDGRRIRGRGLRQSRTDGPDPQFGVYLLGHDPGPFPWPHTWVKWRDFWLPASRPEAELALRKAHERAVTELVEIACWGGVGRTGSALSAIAVLAGVPATDAVEWVRQRYHPRAAEMPWQRRWVRATASNAVSGVTDSPHPWEGTGPP